MKKFLLAILCLLFVQYTNAQDTATKPKIKWMTLEQAFQAIQKEPRKIVVDVYTGWCGWCKVMDQKPLLTQKLLSISIKNITP
jgi:thiol:disulfide interchange protein